MHHSSESGRWNMDESIPLEVRLSEDLESLLSR